MAEEKTAEQVKAELVSAIRRQCHITKDCEPDMVLDLLLSHYNLIPYNPGFEQAARPLVEWLNENSNPHACVIVTGTSAEHMHGIRVFRTEDYVRD